MAEFFAISLDFNSDLIYVLVNTNIGVFIFFFALNLFPVIDVQFIINIDEQNRAKKTKHADKYSKNKAIFHRFILTKIIFKYT